MPFQISPSSIPLLFCLICLLYCTAEVPPMTLERSRSLSLIFSSLQCLTDANTTGSVTIISEINRDFQPESHLQEYRNPQVVQLLLFYIRNNSKSTSFRNDDPFTNSPEHISQMNLILHVLYPNSGNWPLFYNTTAWLINRVNDVQLYWALMVVLGEKFSDSVVAPSAVEVFPQLFLNKRPILQVAGRPIPNEDPLEAHPLQYWMSDPALNEFHLHWHIDNPFWWNATLYGVERYRRGELFLYMHHQLLCRYISEQLSNGQPEVTPLELEGDYQIPEPYYPDIVNVNFMQFPVRTKMEPMRDWDNGQSLQELKTWYDRLIQGIDQGYFLRGNGSTPSESLEFGNNTDILGDTTEASTIKSVNQPYYGSLHNYLHRFLAGTSRDNWNVPGVEAHSETSIRDPVFFRIHKLIDSIYLRLKSHETPYSTRDLDFPGVSIHSVEIQTPKQNLADPGAPWDWERWPFNPQVPTLTTYFSQETYDITTAARPCRSIKDKPTFTNVRILNHVPFKYVVTLKSVRKEVSYGMVRIFLWPEFDQNWKKFDQEESHQRAIELDRFPVTIEPKRDTLISRSSLNSSLTRVEPPPGIRTLYKATASSTNILTPEMGRACGFPNNLLIPKGTTEGMKFKMTVMVTEESKEMKEYPNYPLCGALNGVKYPDERPMGFPFDRPGTRFVTYEGVCLILGGCFYKNVKELKVIVRHKQEDKETELNE